MSQIEKFKEAARQAETDDRQETFDRALKRPPLDKRKGLDSKD